MLHFQGIPKLELLQVAGELEVCHQLSPEVHRILGCSVWKVDMGNVSNYFWRILKLFMDYALVKKRQNGRASLGLL